MPSNDKLSKEQILAALARLNDLLHEKGVMGEICIFGGAAMVLAFDARESTRDVDGIFVPKTEVMESAGNGSTMESKVLSPTTPNTLPMECRSSAICASCVRLRNICWR
jgi:hypothetical protein